MEARMSMDSTAATGSSDSRSLSHVDDRCPITCSTSRMSALGLQKENARYGKRLLGAA
jgi:hypothetical protein